MVLGLHGPGRVGRRRFNVSREPPHTGGSRPLCDDAPVFTVLDAALGVLALLTIVALIWVTTRGDRERDDEDAARAYFDAHGRWPDDPA